MGELEIFANRIKQLRNSLGMTQKDFSEYIGVKQQTLSGYERGIMKPPLDIAKNIAEKCNTSIDWLCGLSNNQSIIKESIWTYADIIEFCFADKIHIPSPSKAILEIISQFTKNMEIFLKELEHMEKLKHDELIDQELFDLWLEKTLKKYQIPIVLKCERHDAEDAFTGAIYGVQYYPGKNEFPIEIETGIKKDSRDEPPQE